jgi:hypothetical protein
MIQFLTYNDHWFYILCLLSWALLALLDHTSRIRHVREMRLYNSKLRHEKEAWDRLYREIRAWNEAGRPTTQAELPELQ